MDTFCQSPDTTNTQVDISNFPNESQVYLSIQEENIKGFKGLTLQSTIKYSAYYHSEEDDAESDPNSDPKVATHTFDGKK